MNNGTGVWAVTQNGEQLVEGAFNDCWKYLQENHAELTMKQFQEQGFKIGKVRES